MTVSGARSVTAAARRTLAAALAATALAGGAAACGSASSSGGSSSGSGSGSASPLASLSGKQLGDQALTNLGKAKSVHVAGQVSSSGEQIKLNLKLLRAHGCTGSMTLVGKGSFRLTMIGKTVWIKPDSQFWNNFGGGNAAALKILRGKYLKTTKTSQLGGLSQLCQPSSLAGAFQDNKKTAGLVKGPATTINGQRAVKLTDSGDSAAAYVSAVRTPELLRIVSPGKSGGQLDFTDYGAPVSLQQPPASQTLDGKKYGF
jgi:hypothetical protein